MNHKFIGDFMKLMLTLIILLFSFSAAFADTDGYFIRWKTNTPEKTQIDFYKKNQMKVVWKSFLVPGLVRVDTKEKQYSYKEISIFNDNENIIYLEPNYKEHRLVQPIISQETIITSSKIFGNLTPNDPKYNEQWALNTAYGIQLVDAWEVAKGSKDIKVAVIDTGVDSKHPEMESKVTNGYDFIDNTPKVSDHHGHGTHVSGVIGAATNNKVGVAGINQEVTIIPLRAVPSDGDETDQNVISSFEFAVMAGARVANCSFGKAKSSKAVGDVIAAAGEKGLLVVVAAGNDGRNINITPTYPASFKTPNMIVVAASRYSGKLAFFSNYGLNAVDIAAPGANILSSVRGNSYEAWDGTSMATPQVVGVAALALSYKPELTVAELKDAILKNVVTFDALKTSVTTGGLLNAAKTLLYLKNQK